MNKSCYDILILGAGPVGLYAAALAHDKGLSVKIIEATNQIGGQVVNLFPNKLIHDFPSYQNILATELVNNLVATVQNANIKINTNEELIHFVKSDDGFECKTTNEEFLK
ncbi:MAG: NAD(P)/FAD-dependent oxidoreductase, partial [Malacoplasma sp.]|nr:NAD(P)/FAD-dependent oxidoreductase [Malacoplasma sp.]